MWLVPLLPNRTNVSGETTHAARCSEPLAIFVRRNTYQHQAIHPHIHLCLGYTGYRLTTPQVAPPAGAVAPRCSPPSSSSSSSASSASSSHTVDPTLLPHPLLALTVPLLEAELLVMVVVLAVLLSPALLRLWW